MDDVGVAVEPRRGEGAHGVQLDQGAGPGRPSHCQAGQVRQVLVTGALAGRGDFAMDPTSRGLMSLRSPNRPSAPGPYN